MKPATVGASMTAKHTRGAGRARATVIEATAVEEIAVV
jgi:hypothetical protein